LAAIGDATRKINLSQVKINPQPNPTFMKNNVTTSRHLAAAAKPVLAFVKPFLLLSAVASMLVLPHTMHAGVTWWDPDGDPANNTGITVGNFDPALSITNETYLLTNSGAGLGVYTTGGPFNIPPVYVQAWENAIWTDDSSVPASLVNPLTTFNEGDDVIFWGPPLSASTVPDVAVTLTANHTVNSLSFYAQLTAAATIFNYELFPPSGVAGSASGILTNISGLINCDAGQYAYANAATLETKIYVPYASANGLQKFGSGAVMFVTNMFITGGPIICSGVTRPGGSGGFTVPTIAQWNTTLNGPYVPFPLNSQIIITNGGILSVNGTKLTTTQPIVIWDGSIGGAGGVQAPEYIVGVCRYGNNTLAEVLNDDGTGNAFLLKTRPEFFGFTTTANSYKGGTIISQGAIEWVQAAPGATPPSTYTSCIGTSTVTMGDANTGNFDVGLIRSTTAPSATTTNMWNNIVVTTNGTGLVFIGNQAMAGIVRMSGTITLGRSTIFGGSGSANQGLTYYPSSGSTARGTIFDGAISGAGGVIVGSVTSTVFATTAADLAAGGFNTGAAWWEGGTVKLTNPNNTYAGGSAVYWGTLEAGANGSLGSGSVTVVAPGVLTLDSTQAIALTANLIMGTNALTPATSNALANLNYSGTCTINALSTNGGLYYLSAGTYGAVGSSAANQSGFFIGNGILQVNYGWTNNVVGITYTPPVISPPTPGIFNLSFQGTPGVYYAVVTSTNIALPLTQWTPVAGSTTLASPANGTWGITVTNVNTAAQYFASLAVP
jgi:hypothetical protein